MFKQAGYRTLGVGKVFSGNERELDPDSWSEPEVLRQSGWKNYVLPENQGPKTKQAAFENADVGDDAYPDGKLTSLAIQSLEDLANRKQPFFLAVGYFKPHLPFNAPRRYWDMYSANLFDLPDRLSSTDNSIPTLAAHPHRELGGYRRVPRDEQLDSRQTRHLRHGYHACVSYVDAQVGKLLEAFEQFQLNDNTIVVVWGDHGYSLGEMNRWCKATNFERDTRVPLLIRTPDLPQPGVASNSLVEAIDLYPTLAELADLPPPIDLDGRSIAPILRDPQAAGRQAVLSQFNRPWTASTPEKMGYSIRTVDYRYTRWIEWETRETLDEELYDYTSSASVMPFGGHLIEHQNIAAASLVVLQRMRNQMDSILNSRIK